MVEEQGWISPQSGLHIVHMHMFFFREFRYSRSRGENYQDTCVVAVSAWRAAGEIIMKYD